MYKTYPSCRQQTSKAFLPITIAFLWMLTAVQNASACSATISASGPTTFCTGGSVTLTASAGVTYVWSTGATTAAISPTTAGTYKVTVTDASSCSTSASQAVFVNSGGTITPYVSIRSGAWAVGSTASLCTGDKIELGPQPTGTWTYTGPAGFHSYQRDTAITNIQISQSGTYVATYYNSNGCTSTQNFVITVSTPLTATVNSPSICPGATATLTTTGSGSYVWSTGATTASISATAAGTYRVTVTAANTCIVTAAGTVTINTPSISVNNASVCTGSTATLTATGGTSYVWSTGAAASSITTTIAGTYTVTATTATGCTATAGGTVTLLAPAINPSSNSPVCIGATIRPYTAATGVSPFTYSWSGPASFSSTSANPAVFNGNNVNGGNYTVTVTDNNGCTASASIAIVMNQGCIDSTTMGANGGNSSNAPCTQILRFDHYNDIVASAAGGQNTTWVLKNSNILTMNIQRVAGGFSAVTAPTWSGAAFGQSGYTGLTGKTVLYTDMTGYSKLVFSNIVLKDSLGNIIPNFTLIGIDGESTDNSERDTLISNGSNWYDYDTITPPSVGSIPSETGIGTSALVWTGTGPVNAVARLVSTNNPSNFTFSTYTAGGQGFAMALANPVQARDSFTICSNSGFNATPTNLLLSTTYTWPTPVVTAGSISGGTAQTIGVSIVSQTLVNTGTLMATVVYTVLPSTTCSGLGYVVKVNVYPAPKALISLPAALCTGSALTVSAVPILSGTYTYSWSGPGSYTSSAAGFTISPSVISNSGTYTVTLTDQNSCTASSPASTIIENCVNVSGAIFDDANGNGMIDGSDAPASLGQALYAVLADSMSNVVSSSSIAANGTFSMSGVLPGMHGYTVFVSSSNPGINTIYGGYSWPSGWVGTLSQYGSNNGAGSGVYNNVSEQTPIATNTGNITDVLIGYDRLPSASAQSYTLAGFKLNAIKNLSAANGLGPMAGTDPEDGTLGVGKSFAITSLSGMNGNTLYYDANGDGILQTNEQLAAPGPVSGYEPAKLYMKFSGAGSTSALFTYSAVDAAGHASGVPASYGMSWGGALPVTLEYFTAAPESGTHTLLSWATASETGNAYYEVERSADALEWEPIGQVPGAGNSSGTLFYSLIDQSPLSGVNYYRLKQVDVDGGFTYSEIAEVAFGGGTAAAALSVHPNPVSHNGALYLNLNNTTDLIKHISVSDATGQVLHTEDITPSHNAGLSNINVSPGIYLLTVTTSDNKQLTSRIVIE